MGETSIEWTDATWNPVRGCSRVSQGCVNCYAEKVAGRFSGPGLPYEGLARIRMKPKGAGFVSAEYQERALDAGAGHVVVGTARGEARWTGEVRMVPEHLADPLRWKRPRRVFVNSMSDLFHEKLSNEDIAAVFGVMAAAPQHSFQVLTKRAGRMREWFEWIGTDAASRGVTPALRCWLKAMTLLGDFGVKYNRDRFLTVDWPLTNVWLGVSVEDQATADERIPELLQTPAAVRFVSYEPALGAVDFSSYLGKDCWCPEGQEDVCRPLDWVIVGGESGPGARPFDVAWARSTVAACRAAGVACFVKQIGARPAANGVVIETFRLRDRKGGDPDEWPEMLRVREFPQ